MEKQQPLLALCTSHWKADHVLGSTLVVKGPFGSVDSDEDSAVEQSADINKKRRLDVLNSPACRQKKSKC